MVLRCKWIERICGVGCNAQHHILIKENSIHWFRTAIMLVALKSEWIKIGRNKEPLFS